jgi:hypothetical protein
VIRHAIGWLVAIEISASLLPALPYYALPEWSFVVSPRFAASLSDGCVASGPNAPLVGPGRNRSDPAGAVLPARDSVFSRMLGTSFSEKPAMKHQMISSARSLRGTTSAVSMVVN